MKLNSAWITVTNYRGIYLPLESEYSKTAKERFVHKILHKRKLTTRSIRLARYLNGVTVGDDEVTNIIYIR